MVSDLTVLPLSERREFRRLLQGRIEFHRYQVGAAAGVTRRRLLLAERRYRVARAAAALRVRSLAIS